MKYIVLTVILSLLLSPALIAQEEETEPNNEDKITKNALGVAVGATSAYGISYRRYIKRFAIQPTFAPYKTENNEQVHAGLTFLFNLVENKRSNFFVYQSNYFYWNKDKYPGYNSWYGPYMSSYEPPSETITHYFNHGLGLGFEFLIVKVVSLNLMGGYGAYEDFERIGITGEAGLYYRF